VIPCSFVHRFCRFTRIFLLSPPTDLLPRRWREQVHRNDARSTYVKNDTTSRHFSLVENSQAPSPCKFLMSIRVRACVRVCSSSASTGREIPSVTKVAKDVSFLVHDVIQGSLHFSPLTPIVSILIRAPLRCCLSQTLPLNFKILLPGTDRGSC
jgi:hypothetical protein